MVKHTQAEHFEFEHLWTAASVDSWDQNPFVDIVFKLTITITNYSK